MDMINNYRIAVICLLVLTGKLDSARVDRGFWMRSTFGHLNPDRSSFIQCTAPENVPIAFSKDGGVMPMSFPYTQPPNTKVLMLHRLGKQARVGVYRCSTTSGGIVTDITTIKQPATTEAHVLPLKAYVTAYAGDTVQLAVTKRDHLDVPLVWALKDKELERDKETLVLKNVTVDDRGVYECFYEGHRQEALHAFIRLHVVACGRGRYGQACEHDCPACRNGGVCHEDTGNCICPSGFTGPHCDQACGANRVGTNCTEKCDAKETRKGCAIHLFCGPDPVGCTCAPGFKGHSCSEVCPRGFYGADCTQRCHCNVRGNCDSITGHCEQGGCLDGWTGESCQIYEGDLSTTPPTTEGQNVDCDAGFFGTNCSRRCNCKDGEPCHRTTGVCPGSCQEGFARSTCSECVHGRFGDNCSFHCHCWNGHENCRKNGTCHDGCAAGWMGQQCQEECKPGKFGPNCVYTCHCHHGNDACDFASGTCNGSCEAGFTGHSCQEQCPLQKFGVNCSGTCDCQNGGTCDPVDGSCTCRGRYRGKDCTHTAPRIQPRNITEINARESASLTCLVDANPAPTIGMHLVSGHLELLNVTTVHLEKDLYQATAQVSGTQDGFYEVRCDAKNSYGLGSKILPVEIVATPVLKDPPEVNMSVVSAQVSWKPWKFTPGYGGRPGDAVEYQLHYRADGGDWSTAGDWQVETEKNVTGLTPDTEYDFAVLLRRANANGGSGDPEKGQIRARTQCGEATVDSKPKDMKSEALSAHEIQLEWQRPTADDLRCHFLGYQLRVRKVNETTWVEHNDVDSSGERYLLRGLEPYTEYEIALGVVTSAWSSNHVATVLQETLEDVPGPVGALKVKTVNATSVELSWSKPAAPNGLLKDYRVLLRLLDAGMCGNSPKDHNESLHVAPDTQISIDELVPNSLYEVNVSAGTAVGYGDHSVLSFRTSKAAPRASPRNVRMTSVGGSSLSFSWDKIPCSDTNGDVTSYGYVLQPAHQASSIVVNTTGSTEVTVDSLVPFRNYTFQVKGVNEAGDGPFSAPLLQETKQEAPGFVGRVEVSNVTDASALLSWEEPDEPNGIVTHYQVTVHSDAELPETSLVTETELELHGLHGGLKYTVDLRAATSAGLGPPSNVSFRTLDQDTPVLKDPPEVNMSVVSAQVSWKPWKPSKGYGRRPGDTVEYKLYYRADGSDWSTAGDWQVETEKNITGLTPDTEYDFAVLLRRANANVGSEGPEKAQIRARTLCGEATVDSKPKDMRSEALSPHEIQLEWQRPTADELRCHFLGYQLRVRKVNETTWVEHDDVDSSGERYLVRGLEPYTEYEIALGVVTSAWSSNHVATVLQETLEDVPGPVGALKVKTVNATSVELSWSKPAAPNGLLKGYRVLLRLLDAGMCENSSKDHNESLHLAPDTHISIDELVPNSLYEVNVSAGTGVGYGDHLDLIFRTSEAAPRASPLNVRVTSVGGSSLSFSWEKIPCSDTNGDVTSYSYVLQSVHQASSIVANTTGSTEITVDSLVPFCNYTFQVNGVNEAGEGPFSAPLLQETKQEAPGFVGRVEVRNVTDTSALLSWEEPDEPNGIVTHYQVTVHSDAELPGTSVTPETELELHGLHGGRKYTVDVRAATSAGLGPPSNVSFRTLDQEPDISLVYVSGDHSTITVKVQVSQTTQPRNLDIVLSEANGPYVTATIAMMPNSSRTFVVGDGFYYGSHFNAPLLPKKKYKIYAQTTISSVHVSSDVITATTDAEPQGIPMEKLASYFTLHFSILLVVSTLLILIILGLMLHMIHKGSKSKTVTVSQQSTPPEECMEMNFYCVNDKPEVAYL
ncbi:protein sidekick-1-like isoform X2 [Ornithodoros turicata]|uniref:protein sidekick-1-like isoform X2 n=1 Tax=Ornithodoros turicata TaxID=34597 RepID=UPI003138B4E4